MSVMRKEERSSESKSSWSCCGVCIQLTSECSDQFLFNVIILYNTITYKEKTPIKVNEQKDFGINDFIAILPISVKFCLLFPQNVFEKNTINDLLYYTYKG